MLTLIYALLNHTAFLFCYFDYFFRKFQGECHVIDKLFFKRGFRTDNQLFVFYCNFREVVIHENYLVAQE